MAELFLVYLSLSVYLILGVIYFCEFITEPVESGRMKHSIKTDTLRTLYWLFVCLFWIVALWPLYLLLKNKLK